ncbi:MAG: ATP-dependent DNA helicase [Opitutales bacterium]|nr:ATP-dependent DNA helicase [Opitutales bacterium]
MATATAETMVNNKPLLFEAGTGCGKSLAYLIPGIIQAVSQKRPCIISTHTISLQEQILNKDIPLCRTLFANIPELEPFADFRATLFVGKGNYLCTTRLVKAINEKADLFGGTDQQMLENLATWSQETSTGLIQDFPPPPPSWELWSSVNADSSVCNSRNCTPETCPYQAARQRLKKADVIILNHSLLFALLNAQGSLGKTRGVLFPHDFLILDEAHTVPATATENFGISLSSFGLDRLLKRLYNDKNRKGLLARIGSKKDIEVVEETRRLATVFFGDIEQRYLGQGPVRRIASPGWNDPILQPSLRVLIQILGGHLEKIDEGPAKDELNDQKKRLESVIAALNETHSLAREDHVHWVEKSGKRQTIITIRAAPIDVAPYLKEALFERKTSVLLTSATLAPVQDIGPFAKIVGADQAATGQVPSPFPYQKNCRAFVVRDMAAPALKTLPQYRRDLADYIHFFIDRVPGGSLVLFTSYNDLREVSQFLREPLKESGRTLLEQTGTLGRAQLAQRFREIGNAVLFGTDSFWTGIDIPGPALSQVIVTRLPFENPSHPIVEAKMEWIRQHGGNPFQEHTLPQALIKFRQGIGRLIRKHSDYGRLVLLDSRILRKPYGRLFLDALPDCPQEIIDRDNREFTVPVLAT